MKLFKVLNTNRILFLNMWNLFSLILILLIFSIDRFSKIKVLSDLNNSYFVNEYINLDLIWNTGIGFGLLSFDSLIIYNIITSFIFLVILALFYIAITSKKFDKLVYSIIIGGALGNIYDRLYYNAVPDFIDLHYENLHWFVFNVADIFITLGILTFLLKGFFIRNK